MTFKKLNASISHLTYFPFIGWFLPMILKKDDPFLTFHAKQGFVMAAFFGGVCSIIYIITGFFSSSGSMPKFVLVVTIYINYVVYLIFCIAGWFQIKKKNEKEFPLFSRLLKKIEI